MKLNYLSIAMLLCGATSNQLSAQTAPSFGAAQQFSICAYSTVTNTGNTTVNCNVGVSPGSSITGFLPGKITLGSKQTEVASLAGPAMVAAQAVFNNLTSQVAPAGNDLTGKVLGETAGAITLNPGVYTFSSSAQLNATLTLNDGGNPDAVFIFKIGSTITTASYSKVVMSSGGKGKNVFWQIGSSATIGTYTNFIGNIIATASITMTTGCTTTGKLFALNGAVTLDTNEVQVGMGDCSGIVDTDGDGVPDTNDAYPKDPKKAFNNYNTTALASTIAFEDLWPAKGDYDMNDLIVDYKFNVVTNAQNKVVQVIGNFALVDGSGDNNNGFGVQFPIGSNAVSNVAGATLESGQDKAVIILFNDMHQEMLNRIKTTGLSQPAYKLYTISFDVNNAPSLADFGTDFNPFLLHYAGNSRHEVHPVGKIPTTLIDQSLFGSQDDYSKINIGQYFISKTGLPFCLNLINGGFIPAAEGQDVTLKYLHFAQWAQSGGTDYPDWYSNTAPGYRL